MKMFGIVIFVWSVLVSYSSSLVVPAYIKPCSVSDPNFEQCSLEHGREALPALLKGDRKYKIPNLVPLKIPAVTVDAGENLKVYFRDMSAYGLDKLDLQQVKIDVKNQKLIIAANIDRLSLVGKYTVDGKILVLPIKGDGDVNITGVNGKYKYETSYTLTKIGGEEHIKLSDNDHLDFKLEKALFKLDNLFNGDEVLGPQMNKFLNDNWEEVLSEIGGAISQTVGTVIKLITGGIFDKISYRQLFLE